MQNQSGYLREDALLTQGHRSSEGFASRKRSYRGLIDANSLQMLEEKREMFYLLSFIVHNTKPVGHQVARMNLRSYIIFYLYFLQI